MTANALLLLLEGAGLVALGALYLGPLGVHWPLTPEYWEAERLVLLTGAGLAALAVMSVTAGWGFLRMRRGAWLVAVTVQGLGLLIALLLYYKERPGYVYLMMVSGILMVLSLHQADVQAVFQPKAEDGAQGELPR